MKKERLQLLNQQQRAYCEGTIDFINNEWVFFDSESEEAFPLENFLYREVLVLRMNQWKKGVLTENFIIENKHVQYKLKEKDSIRIKKNILFSFEILLQDLTDDSFFLFIRKLNDLQFSIFDILYCYNHLHFSVFKKAKGVNFFILDNGEAICSVHHHFNYDKTREDRFEFTLNNGKRAIVQQLQRDHKHEH
ncbi:DUF2777 family protein [Bacillus kwashiorkori]|uniref:DUF2777 family protein n=1 Tax=Bacillus kwashiorkori TaxID=1522318 RepID=UPI00078298F8|nr:DUF2777 family protein [Bacillus kwashiorkori]